MWSAQMMVEYPELVGQIHYEYFKAGATIATTNTYSCHKERFERFNIEHKYKETVQRAVQEARRAIEEVSTEGI